MGKKKLLNFIIFLVVFLSKGDNPKFVIGEHLKCGFFATLEGTLYKIIWAKKNNRTPVIYWGPNFLYFQKNGYNNSLNGWEYYFEPVSELKYLPGEPIYKRFTAPNQNAFLYINKNYDENFYKKRLWLHNILKGCLKIKSNIKLKINEFYKKHMQGKKVIGIHLRGTDKFQEAKKVDHSKILQQAKLVAKNSFDDECKFFVATDEMKLLQLAEKILGQQNIIYCNFRRSMDGKPIHFSKINPASLGEEVLIDTILLSKCDVFFHTLSNIATFVMLFNPHIKNYYIT